MTKTQETRNLRELELTFGRGLIDAAEASTLPEGAAVECQNWVPEAAGGVRARPGWSNGGTTGVPATRRGLGLGYIASPNQRFLLALESTLGTTVSVYHVLKSNPAGAWTTLEAVAVGSGASNPVSFALGNGRAFYTHKAFGGVRQWDGTAAAAGIAGSPAGARGVAFHKNRIFAASSSAAGQAARLFYSNLEDGLTWGVTSYIEVGKDDGEALEALASYGDYLLIGKENSLWLLSGAGPSSFQLHQLEDGGCAPGRTLVATPKGVVVVGREQVWLFAGGPPQLISGAIAASYGMTGTWMSAAYLDGRCYITDQGQNKLWTYDLARQAWSIETMPSVAEDPVALTSQGDYLLAAPSAATVSSGLIYRRLPPPAGVRAKDFDTHTEAFRLVTPELWLGGPQRPFTLRHVELQLRQRGGNAGQTGLTVTPTIRDQDGVSLGIGAQTIAPRAAAGVFRTRLDFGATGYSCQLALTQTLASGEAALFDVENVRLLYDLEGYR